MVNPDATTNGEKNLTRRDYTWNERNLLKRSADSSYNVTYVYGADGERRGKFSKNNNNVASETLYFNKLWSWYYNGFMQDQIGRNSKNIYLDDTRIVTKLAKADGSVTDEERQKQFFYHSDHLGSAQLITDHRRNEYEHIEYTPYGELWIEKLVDASSMLDTPFRFTGKERDKETGLYYFGARYLDARTSRWLSTDPALGEYIPSAPINDEAKKRNGNLPGMGGVFNTVNAHLYHYAGNNPIRLKDPDGRKFEYAKGSSPEFKKDIEAMREYLGDNKILKKLDELETVITIEKKENTYFDYATNTLYVNPRKGLEIQDNKGNHTGKFQSPALGFLHEAFHAFQAIFYPGAHKRETVLNNSKWGKKEEKRAIKTVETPAAKKLGEPTRNNHFGISTEVTGPTSKIPVNKGTDE